MIKRLYIHNFRCLQNFEFRPGDQPSILLLGKNGVGKSTVARVLGVLQQMAAGPLLPRHIITSRDFAMGRTNEPISIELQLVLGEPGVTYDYTVSLEYSAEDKTTRIASERFSVGGDIMYAIERGMLTNFKPIQAAGSGSFAFGQSMLALPVLMGMEGPQQEHLRRFSDWLANIIILAPIPQLMVNEENTDPKATLKPTGANLAPFLCNIIAAQPNLYDFIVDYLKPAINNLDGLQPTERSLSISFTDAPNAPYNVDFDLLSDGEKCHFLGAAVLAELKRKNKDHLLVFWDEPDNYLALQNIQSFILDLRRAFKATGGSSQIWMTTHNAQTINCLPKDSAYYMRRGHRHDPVTVRPLVELYDGKASVVLKMIHDELEG